MHDFTCMAHSVTIQEVESTVPDVETKGISVNLAASSYCRFFNRNSNLKWHDFILNVTIVFSLCSALINITIILNMVVIGKDITSVTNGYSLHQWIFSICSSITEWPFLGHWLHLIQRLSYRPSKGPRLTKSLLSFLPPTLFICLGACVFDRGHFVMDFFYQCQRDKLYIYIYYLKLNFYN